MEIESQFLNYTLMSLKKYATGECAFLVASEAELLVEVLYENDEDELAETLGSSPFDDGLVFPPREVAQKVLTALSAE